LASGAKIGDRFVLSILDQVTLPLAHALNVLVGSVGVEKIIVVGGFALGVGPPYLRALRSNWIRLGSFGRTSREIKDLVTLGISDDYSGLIGAGILVQAEARQ
jgi:glucokinase